MASVNAQRLDLNEIEEALRPEKPAPDRVRTALLNLYARATGQTVPTDTALSGEQGEAISRWLNDHAETLLPMLEKSSGSLIRTVFFTLSDKVYRLSQDSCALCPRNVKPFPAIQFNLRGRAISTQSAHTRRRAFAAAVRERVEQRRNFFSPDTRLCVTITVVLGRGAREKDADNMAKAILDAMKTVVFGDDIRIDHLRVLKLRWPKDEHCLSVAIHPSGVSSMCDVVVSEFHHSWGGQAPLNVDNFLNTK